MGLKFTLEQQQISTIFKQYRNSINIYTEDTVDDKEFYIMLLKRLLYDTDIEINDIYPLGSSNDVIEACKKDNDTRFKKIYIVDGDIFLMYQPKKSMNDLFVLDAYCIENLIIDKNAISQCYYNLLGTKRLEEIQSIIEFEKMMECIKDPIIDLFFNYAISNQYLGYFTLYNIDAFLCSKSLDIDQKKIQDQISSIKRSLIEEQVLTESKYLEEIRTKQSLYSKNIDTLLTIVSGKDFLIPYIRKHCSKKLDFDVHLPRKSWKFHLAKYCDLRKLTKLKTAILNA